MFHGHTPVVLRPGSVAEVSDILKLANETSTAIVPQGGNTGLVGGQIAAARRGRALAQPPRPDPRGRSRLQHHDLRGRRDAAARARGAPREVDRLYPLLARRRRAAAPSAAISRPMPAAPPRSPMASRARMALGLEVVLADGRVLQQSQQAEEGQHRLRPARTCSSAPKARSASSPPRCCGWFRGRARSRPRSSACPRRRRRSNCSGSRPSAPRGGVTSFELMLRHRASSSVLQSRRRLPRSACRASTPGTC